MTSDEPVTGRPGDGTEAARPAPDRAPPSTIQLVTVNVGVPTLLAEVPGDYVWSGISKRPVPSSDTLWLSTLNLSGDGQADLSVHGGPDKAVYAYPSEHLDDWRDELDEDLGPSPFGENLSTRGALEQEVRVGDVWSWGDALLQVCQPRWPCFKLAIHRHRADIQARFRRSGRTGWYLRVLSAGEVPAGGPIEVARVDELGVTVEDAHLAMDDVHRDRPDLIRAVADHPALAEQWRIPLLERLER
jgi:MOSC domain-containing protein YiiM